MTFTKIEMWRETDESGVSGTGKVAEGVRFSDGSIVLRWLTAVRSTVHYDSLADAKKIHGHDGKTRIYCVGDAWNRGNFEAHLDRNEGVHDFLQYKRNGGKPQRPDWIVESDWRLFLKGYEQGLLDQRFDVPWCGSDE